MTVDKQTIIQIVWHQVTLIERFSSVLYPLDTLELLKRIPTIGYVVPELVLRGTLEQGKPIATRGDIELLINQDNKTLGVRGRQVEKTLESFNELQELYLTELDPSPGLTTQYLEFGAQGWAKSAINPSLASTSFWNQHEPLLRLGKVIDENVTNHGVQLVPPNKDPNDPDWFHIQIEPLVISSHKRYSIRWIWRSSDKAIILKRFSRLDEMSRELIVKIEG